MRHVPATRSGTTWTRSAGFAPSTCRCSLRGMGRRSRTPRPRSTNTSRTGRREARLAEALDAGERSRELLDAAWDDVHLGSANPRRRWPCRRISISEAEGRLGRRAGAVSGIFPGKVGRAGVGLVHAASPQRRPLGCGGSSFGARPRTEGAMRLSGLDGVIEVRRDRWGRAAHHRADQARPVVRPGLLPGAGPALAARAVPPRRTGGWRRSPGRPRCATSDRFMRTLGLGRAGLREAAEIDRGSVETSRRWRRV